MPQTETPIEMGRDKLFTMRVSEEELAQLESLAANYGLTVAGYVRLLISRDARDNEAKSAASKDPLSGDGFDAETANDIIREIPADGIERDDLARQLNVRWDAKGRQFRAFSRLMNELRRAGYVTKRSGAYFLTAKGEAYFAENE